MIIKIGDEILKEKENVKFLGLYIDNKLNWQEHIKNLKSKLNSSIYAMNKVKRQLNTNILTTLYYTLIYPYIDYGITLWGSAYSTHLKKIMVMQKKSVRIIVKAKYNEHTDPIFKELKILRLEDIYKLNIAKYMFGIHTLPVNINKIVINNRQVHEHNTRNINNPHVRQRKTQVASKSFRHIGPLIWYQIPIAVKDSKSIKSFKSKYTKHILHGYSARL